MGRYVCVWTSKKSVNPQIMVNQYPLQHIDEFFYNFTGSFIFCHLDLTNACLQLQVDEQSKCLLTVNTINGLYTYNRLVFGLASSPAIFQMLMNNILRDIKNCACYLDDILIGGKTNKSVERC